MAAQAASNHLYFQSRRREVPDYDSGHADTANERSFDNGRETSMMRDASIQQGNGMVRRVSTQSRVTDKKKILTDKSGKYVSPFILSAERKAQERADRYQESKRKLQKPAWDDKFAPTGSLFDPTIHKQDIFKIQPRKKVEEDERKRSERQLHDRTHTHHHQDDVINFKPNGHSRMTIKTSGSFPIQMKRLQERAAQHRAEAGTSPLQSFQGESLREIASSSGNAGRPMHAQYGQQGQGSSSTGVSDTDSASAGASANNAVAVTRSTSPISEHVVSSILREDGLVHDDDYTIHIKSYQPLGRVGEHSDERASASGADPNAPYDTLYDPAYDQPPRDEAYYSNLLRRRLRSILVNHNDDSAAEEVEVTDYEDLNTSEERGRRRNRNNYADRKYLRSISQGRSQSRGRAGSTGAAGRGATEELMHSMAQIMTAVGSIVSRPEKKKYKSVLKRHARRKSAGAYIAPFEVSHGTAESAAPWQGMQDRGCHDYGAPSSSHAAQQSSRAHHAAAAAAPVRPHRSRPHSSAPSTAPAPHAALHTAGLFPAEVPRTRAAMIDLILAKLQGIEAAEQETAAFLADPRRHQSAEESYHPSHYGNNESSDVIDRHLQGVRTLDVTQLGSNAASAPEGAHREEDSSIVVEAQSELDISANFLHYPSDAPQQRREVATSEQGTQDSAYTLEHLDAHLQQAARLAARQPSVSALQQREEQRSRAPAPQLTAEQLRAKESAYLSSLPKVPRNPRTEESIHAYMRELDSCRELKDVAFRSRGVSMAQVADRMAEEVCAQLLREVAGEVDTCLDQYSDKFLNKI